MIEFIAVAIMYAERPNLTPKVLERKEIIWIDGQPIKDEEQCLLIARQTATKMVRKQKEFERKWLSRGFEIANPMTRVVTLCD